MAISKYKRESQTRLFAQRTYDKQKDAELITKNTERLIDKAIREGKTPDELKKIFTKEARKAENYAKTAMRTDVTRIENKARDDLYNEVFDLGANIIKMWNAVIDTKTRDSHAHMNGEEQLTDDKFSNGGKYPGDSNLPPEERMNCRCWITSKILNLNNIKSGNKIQSEYSAHSRVATVANELIRRGVDRSEAFQRSWAIEKINELKTAVKERFEE